MASGFVHVSVQCQKIGRGEDTVGLVISLSLSLSLSLSGNVILNFQPILI